VTGVVAGAASTLYAERKLRQTLEAASARLAPDALVSEVGRTARHAARTTGDRVRDAVTTGRSEMQRREEEIWAGLGSPTADADGRIRAPDATGPPVDGATVTGAPRGPRTSARTRVRRRSRRSPSHLGK
jgi:hypothetical protein